MTAHAPGKVALRAVDAAAPLRVDVPQRISDILAEKLPEDVVAGLLPRQSVAVLFGDANCGKLFSRSIWPRVWRLAAISLGEP
jgi:hypothetical protein